MTVGQLSLARGGPAAIVAPAAAPENDSCTRSAWTARSYTFSGSRNCVPWVPHEGSALRASVRDRSLARAGVLVLILLPLPPSCHFRYNPFLDQSDIFVYWGVDKPMPRRIMAPTFGLLPRAYLRKPAARVRQMVCELHFYVYGIFSL